MAHESLSAEVHLRPVHGTSPWLCAFLVSCTRHGFYTLNARFLCFQVKFRFEYAKIIIYLQELFSLLLYNVKHKGGNSYGFT